MPPKQIKLAGGMRGTVKSIRLANGNLLILKRTEADRNEVEWVEVEPGTSDFKRWAPVACDEADPRTAA
jgi:hypothetical protein